MKKKYIILKKYNSFQQMDTMFRIGKALMDFVFYLGMVNQKMAALQEEDPTLNVLIADLTQ